jgi:hypothetical protein
MKNGAGKATNQSGFNTLMVGKGNLQKNHHFPMISDLKASLMEQHDGAIVKSDDPHLTGEKWLREPDIRERNTRLQNKNFVQKPSSTTQLRVPLDEEPCEKMTVNDG